MNKNRMLQIAIAAFLFLSLASQSHAWGRAPERNRDRLNSKISKDLNLSKEQKDKFAGHNKKMKEAMKLHRKEMKDLADKFKHELQKDDPKREDVHVLIRKIGQKRTEMEIRRIDNLFELRKMLTPKQRAKFKKMLINKKQRWGKRAPKKR